MPVLTIEGEEVRVSCHRCSKEIQFLPEHLDDGASLNKMRCPFCGDDVFSESEMLPRERSA
jgi:hypothetical protein